MKNMKNMKKTIIELAVILAVVGIALGIYFGTALKRDYLYELFTEFDPNDGAAYVYQKGTTMYVTAYPSLLKKPISNGIFPYEWQEDITRVVIVDEITPESIEGWFANMKNLEVIEGLEKLDVSGVTRFNNVFQNCIALEDLSGVENWDTSSATHMEYTFAGCHSLRTLNLSHWDVSNVERMTAMFSNAGLEEIEGLEDWDVENLQSINSMFNGCHKLETVGDLNNWELSDDCQISRAFDECDMLWGNEPYWAQ